jgi:hypothetical protein
MIKINEEQRFRQYYLISNILIDIEGFIDHLTILLEQKNSDNEDDEEFIKFLDERPLCFLVQVYLGYYHGRDGYQTIDPYSLCLHNRVQLSRKLSEVSRDSIKWSIETLQKEKEAMIDLKDALHKSEYEE